MSDVFLSYAKEDRDRARVLAEALEACGWSVFWDRTIPAGLTWREFIGKELEEARSVVVAWSEAAVKSEWVLEEAEQAKKKRILIPVFIESVEAPLGFGSLQAADLSSWGGDSDAPAFHQLAGDMGRLLGATPPEASPVRAARDAEAASGRGAENLLEERDDQADAREVEKGDQQAMSYLKDKVLPGAIGAVVVALILGLVSAASSGGLIRWMGGATDQQLDEVRGESTEARNKIDEELRAFRTDLGGELAPANLKVPLAESKITEERNYEPESYLLASNDCNESQRGQIRIMTHETKRSG